MLAIDPSGSFKEGKGCSGFCLYDAEKHKVLELCELDSVEYAFAEEYWYAHIKTITDLLTKHQIKSSGVSIVVEEYLLYADKAQAQINSRFETSQLIGTIRVFMWELFRILVILQSANRVKQRWANKVLLSKEILYRSKSNKLCLTGTNKSTSAHERDALRHAIHYAYFGKEKK